MSVFCRRPSVWTLPSDVQSQQAARRLGSHNSHSHSTGRDETEAAPNVDPAPPSPHPPVSHEASGSAAASAAVLCLSVSASGRLLCALTSQCVWLYSVLAEDCVCLGGWKRSPRLHEEEGDNTAVAFNHFTASTAGDTGSSAESGRGGAVGVAGEDEDAVGALYDESQCVLAVLTSRHVLNVLRVAPRPDLALSSQQQHNAFESGRPHSNVSSAAPVASSSASHPIQSTLSLSWSTSSPPAVAVSCQSTPCLFGFPAAEWHDAVTVSSAVHQPVSVHLLARVKLSNDYVTCVSACRDGFLLGTAGGFVQRVALDGRPVSCMHALLAVEPQQQQQQHQQAATAANPSSQPSPGISSLCVSHPLHILAFVLLDGRVGAFDERLLQPTAPTHQQSEQQQRIQDGFSARWLQQPAAEACDVAVCVAIDDNSRRLAVGWRRSHSLLK